MAHRPAAIRSAMAASSSSRVSARWAIATRSPSASVVQLIAHVRGLQRLDDRIAICFGRLGATVSSSRHAAHPRVTCRRALDLVDRRAERHGPSRDPAHLGCIDEARADPRADDDPVEAAAREQQHAFDLPHGPAEAIDDRRPGLEGEERRRLIVGMPHPCTRRQHTAGCAIAAFYWSRPSGRATSPATSRPTTRIPAAGRSLARSRDLVSARPGRRPTNDCWRSCRRSGSASTRSGRPPRRPEAILRRLGFLGRARRGRLLR